MTVTVQFFDASPEAMAEMALFHDALLHWPSIAPPMVTCQYLQRLVWFVYACEDCEQPHYARRRADGTWADLGSSCGCH